MFQCILLEEQLKDYKNITKDAEPNVIDHLDQINIFIGPNNSGKSRFLRSIFKYDDSKYKSSEFNLDSFNEQIIKFKEDLKNLFSHENIMSISFYEESILNTIDFLNAENLIKLKQMLNTLQTLSSSAEIKIQYSNFAIAINDDKVRNAINGLATSTLSKIKITDSFIEKMCKEENVNIYLPTLRGLRAPSYNGSGPYIDYDCYNRRTQDDYFPKETLQEGTIYTGLNLFKDVKDLMLGNNEARKKLDDFEKFIGDTFFDGQKFEIIPSNNDNAVHISIDGKADRPIYHLGDGIQSIIILIYPLFFNTGKRLRVFYEEPDIYLHPGFQRIFVEVLLRPEFKNFQFFFTTHSNHFLDMTLDYSNISVYSFLRNPEENFTFENVENTNSDLLSNLGVRNSSVFLTNCTIWVEGITDRIYIRKLLALFLEDESKKQFKEDVHYSFVEYGGNNITHWSFLDDEDEKAKNINVDRLCSRLFLITDSDNAELKKNGEPSRKKQRHQKLSDKLNERYYCFTCREIENLLTKDVILKAIRSLDSEENKSKIVFKADKPFTDKMGIGKFIDNNIEGKKTIYGTKSGTIKNKVEFAKAAVDQIYSFDDLSEEAKQLAEKLYAFIQAHNS